MEVIHIECDLNLLTKCKSGSGVNSGNVGRFTTYQIQEYFITHQLGDVHLGVYQ